MNKFPSVFSPKKLIRHPLTHTHKMEKKMFLKYNFLSSLMEMKKNIYNLSSFAVMKKTTISEFL